MKSDEWLKKAERTGAYCDTSKREECERGLCGRCFRMWCGVSAMKDYQFFKSVDCEECKMRFKCLTMEKVMKDPKNDLISMVECARIDKEKDRDGNSPPQMYLDNPDYL